MALAEQLGIARGTVREAITVLVHDGLLVRAPYRGAMVPTLDGSDVTDIFRARRVIELSGVDAARTAEEYALRRVAAAIDEHLSAVAAGDEAAVTETDIRVHGAIVALVGSARLNAVHTGLMTDLRMLLAQANRSLGYRDEGTAQRSEAFRDLLLRREVATCRELLTDRLARGEQELLQVLERRPAGQVP